MCDNRYRRDPTEHRFSRVIIDAVRSLREIINLPLLVPTILRPRPLPTTIAHQLLALKRTLHLTNVHRLKPITDHRHRHQTTIDIPLPDHSHKLNVDRKKILDKPLPKRAPRLVLLQRLPLHHRFHPFSHSWLCQILTYHH